MSSPAAERRALELFDELLDVPPHEQLAWIDAHAGSDAELARELRSLVSAAARSSGILDLSAGIAGAPDMIDAVRAAFAGGYEILREIGRGGMATVYLARERKHEREVVIKVLDPSIAHLFGADRFLREVRIAAMHPHPHIVPLIDSGDADGFLYYVMPWLGGETLRARLERGRPSVTEGIGILRDIAGALDFAHGVGVVHRDLKPENVLVTAGHAYLLDFGIAKLLDESPAAMNITVPGLAVGTRKYMAPEQAFASDAVDARADIYAWGVLGIELFSPTKLPEGEPAIVGPAALAKCPDLPQPLVSLLLECVEPTPARRPESMAVVVKRLDALARLSRATRPAVARRRRGLIGAGVAVIALAALVIAMKSLNSGAATGLAEPVAVTILRNETGDSSLSVVGRYAGDWVTDGLQRMGTVAVVPWSEALLASDHATKKGGSLGANMHEEAHAGTIVTGAFYKLRDSLRLQAQLSDAKSGRVVAVLAEIVVPANQPESGIAQLRDRVMGAVATARDERVAALPDVSRNPPSFSAYQAFDQGMEHFLAQRYDSALAGFREAANRDPTFTIALLLGARAAWNSNSFAVAESLVARARSQPRQLGAYNEAMLRYIEALLKGDGVVARAAIARAAALAPNSRAGFDYAQSLLDAGYAKKARDQLMRMEPDRGEMRGWGSYWVQRAHAAHIMEDAEEALHSARELSRRYPDRRVALVLEARALALAEDTRALDSVFVAWDSLPTNVYWSQGAAMSIAGEELQRRGREVEGKGYSERAVKWLANRLVATPNDRAFRYWMGTTLYNMGRYDEARPYFEGLVRDFPDRMTYHGLAALTAARRGDTTAANAWLGTPAPRDTGEYLAFKARVAAIGGDIERAIALLTSAMDRGVDAYPWLRGQTFRDFAVLAREPRGRALLSGR